MNLPPSAAVRSKAVVLSLIHCLLLPSLFVCVCGGGGGVFGPCFVMQYLVSFKFLVLQSSAWAKRAGCFTLIVCLMSWLFFTVPWVGVQFVIMVLPVHTLLYMPRGYKAFFMLNST